MMKYCGDRYKKGVLYLIVRYCYILLSYIIINMRRRKYVNKKYTLAICAIFKNEADFLKEWIEYHLLIGVDHFYLYNNFSDDNYLEVLSQYQDKGCITLIDWPIQHGQKLAYKDCYLKFKDEVNWLAYIDLDEFICLKYELDIKKWLHKFVKYPSVLINWKVFGTSGIIEHDKTRLVIEQYTSSYPLLSIIGKSIINTSFDFDRFDNQDVHLFYSYYKIGNFRVKLLPVNEFSRFLYYWTPRYPLFAESKIQLNHYIYRSYMEFLYKNNVRGDAESSENEKRRKLVSFEAIENQNITKDYVIQRFLTSLKVKMI